MADTYTEYAEICSHFYDCTADSKHGSDFLMRVIQPKVGKTHCLWGVCIMSQLPWLILVSI